ncbi:MAG: hypothetical protein FWD83_06650 [Promicromonosporaceae bacterium]|nr:hypothetical protein [Promicromonosporaceae bacterium]
METSLVLETIGWIGSALIVISLMVARVLRFRWMNMTGSVIATAYNAIIGVWPFVAMNAAIVIINAYWLVKLYRTRRDEAVYEVVEVRPDDAFLLHLQRSHAQEIASFSPGFESIPGEDERRLAFMVVKADETVGMVEIRDEGDGVGVVLLDWVFKPFRDFTPGEFVYRQSGIFHELGFTQLQLATDMTPDAKYLSSVGFQQKDDTWVLPIGQSA